MTEFTFAVPPRLARCPYCGTGRPQVVAREDFGALRHPSTGGYRKWAVYICTCCSGLLLAQGPLNNGAQNAPIEQLYPEVRSAAPEVPEPGRRYLQQAFESLHAPDAAAVMAGSAVDAMLKHHGLSEGSVYERIDRAVATHILTPAMGEWAHEVRLGSNRPRHADQERPHVNPAEASQSVEFAEALGHFLFVLPSRVARGIEAAKIGKG